MQASSINSAAVTRLPDAQIVSLDGDRKNNQDRAAAFCRLHSRLLVLGDGMGGHADGAAAAQCLIDCAEEMFASYNGEEPLKLLQSIATHAHEKISALRPDLLAQKQPRTTATLCLIEGHQAVFGHAGDSRCYQFRKGSLMRRTRDHSVVEMLFRTGRIEEEQMRTHPMRNQVSRCLGGSGHPPALEFTPCAPLENGDILLLCSDGFWEPLSDAELEVGHAHPKLGAVARTAVQRHPGRADNCTVLRWAVSHV